MSKDRSLVRASDIGAWTFCHRAWWLANVQHAEHELPAVLTAGERAHRAHGTQLVQAFVLQRIGLVLLAAGAIVGGIFVLSQLLAG